VVGEAEVIKVFKLTGARSAAVGGCRVKQGKMIRKSTFRVVRGDEVD
jgi:translation initiation factor IF-2